MAYVLCTLNITVKLRVKFGEALTVKRPLLVWVYEGSASTQPSIVEGRVLKPLW